MCTTRDKAALDTLGGGPAVMAALGVSQLEGVPTGDLARRRDAYGENTFPEKPLKAYWEFVKDALQASFPCFPPRASSSSPLRRCPAQQMRQERAGVRLSYLRMAAVAQDPTLIILIVAACLSLGAELSQDPVEGWHDGTSILFSVLVVVNVASYNDFTQSRQFAALNAEKRNVAVSAVRDGRRVKVSIYDLVVGDIVELATGDAIPADGLLVSGQKLVADESSMTGESEPMAKDPAGAPFLLSGCKVTEGSGAMVVVAVGLNTEWGRIMAVTSEDNDEETPLQNRLDKVATSIGKVGTVVAIVVFAVLCGRNLSDDPESSGSGAWYRIVIDAFIVGVTIVVVAVPARAHKPSVRFWRRPPALLSPPASPVPPPFFPCRKAFRWQ